MAAFLEVCGLSEPGGGGYSVPSHSNPNRDGVSGTRQLVKSLPSDVAANPIEGGVPGRVKPGDMVKLINQYKPDNRVLDKCGLSLYKGGGANGYQVHTSKPK